jgi:hypothetical protein
VLVFVAAFVAADAELAAKKDIVIKQEILIFGWQRAQIIPEQVSWLIIQVSVVFGTVMTICDQTAMSESVGVTAGRR